MDAMAAIPEWAPAGEDHLLRSSSVIQKIIYASSEIKYSCFDNSSSEVLRLAAKPKAVFAGIVQLKENHTSDIDCWTWEPLKMGGVLRINHSNGNQVLIKKS